MHPIRFVALILVSFVVVTIGAFLTPGTFVNRAFSVAFCTASSFNSTFCAASLAQSSDRVVAANPPAIETTIPHSSPYLQAQYPGTTAKYCNVQKDEGWWLVWSTDRTADPCRNLLTQQCSGSGCRIVSQGAFSLNASNQVSVNCQGFSQSFVGNGDTPLRQAFEAVTNPFRPSCIFLVGNLSVATAQPDLEDPNPNVNRPEADNPDSSSGNSDRTSDSSPSDIEQEMLNAHNQWRNRVDVPPLRWSNQLASYAQDWANQLVARGAFEHRPDGQYGENIFMGSGRPWSPTEVVNDWGSEVQDYDYATNSCRGTCGHYTQIVWRDTKELGCGVARSGNEEVWVCNYNPPGNFIGRKPY